MDHFAARTWCPAGQSEGDAPAPDIRRSGCRNLEPAPIGDRRIFDAHAPHPTPGNPHPTTAIAWGPPDLRLGIPRERGPPSKHLPPHEIFNLVGTPGLRSSVTHYPNALPPVLPPHEAGFVGTPAHHPTKEASWGPRPRRLLASPTPRNLAISQGPRSGAPGRRISRRPLLAQARRRARNSKREIRNGSK